MRSQHWAGAWAQAGARAEEGEGVVGKPDGDGGALQIRIFKPLYLSAVMLV